MVFRSHICINQKHINDTSTIEIDTLEFSRLVLEGKNIRFEELPCKDQKLSFEILQSKLKEKIQIETFNRDTLKTLNLYDDVNGFNNAAGLLADKNHFPGFDMVKFGENISVIQKRITVENTSVLDIYEKALSVFRDYYQYEVIQGADRKMVEKIPEAAFREAIANALIHRVWDVDSQIRVSMFDDKIEVVSPGGLPSGITEDEYLSGKLCNGVQREHNKKLNNGLPILHKVPPKRDYGRYFCIMAEKGGTSHGGLTEKLSPFFHAKKQEVNAYGR